MLFQVNLADFYRKEAKRRLLPFHSANLIQSRKLYIDDEDLESDYDQVAMESSFTNDVNENEISQDEDHDDLNLVSDEPDGKHYLLCDKHSEFVFRQFLCSG